MNVYRATIADADDVLELMQMQFIDHRIGFEISRLRSAISHLLAPEGPGFILIARHEGRPLGFAAVSFAWTLEHGGKSAWLDELYVVPQNREEGTGTALLDAVLTEASSHSCLAIDLEVDKEHQRAEHLYKRKGFHELARKRWVKHFG
jgi:GNAT superfamily N-acetyltransferase